MALKIAIDKALILLYFYPAMESVHVRFYSIHPMQERTDGWDTTWRTLPNVLLERPHQGAWKCSYMQGGKTAVLEVPAEHILIMPVACRHRLQKLSSGKMHSDWSYISWQSGVQELRTADLPMVFKPVDAAAFNPCFCTPRNKAEEIQAQAAALQLLALFLQANPVSHVPSDDRIQRVITYMHLHLHTELRREDLAAICHLSATRFHDVFIAATGIAPMRYLTRLRLKLAQSLLDEGTRSIAQVAEASGFQSQAYFNRVFKQAFGQSPGQQRQRSLDNGKYFD